MKDNLRSLGFVALLLGAAYAWRWDGMQQARAEAATAGLQVRIVRLTDTIRKQDTVYRFKRDTLTSVITHYGTIRSTDTLVRIESLPGRVDTVVYTRRSTADSAVTMCMSVVFGCEERIATRDRSIAARDSVIASMKASQPSRLQRIMDKALWASAGYGVCKLTSR